MKYVKSILAAALTVSVMTVGAPAQAATPNTTDTSTSTTSPAPVEQTAAQKAAAKKKKAAAEKRKQKIAKKKAAIKKKRALAAKKKRIAAKKKAARGGKIVRVAAKYKGTPYVWGGTTPKGFDCSGYVQYVVKKAVGKKLPRIAGDQMRAAKKVSKNAKRKGDLIGFTNGSGYYHIGIYAGDGKIWHAPRTGETVKKVKIWTGGYTVARP